MEEYKVRFIEEFNQLSDRLYKLRLMLFKHNNNRLEFELNSSIDILELQEEVMSKYLDILRVRALAENICLGEDVCRGYVKKIN